MYVKKDFIYLNVLVYAFAICNFAIMLDDAIIYTAEQCNDKKTACTRINNECNIIFRTF